jgi:hypothetical protein
VLGLIFGFVFNFTAWGKYLYAIGSNENAARLTGRAGEPRQDAGLRGSGLTRRFASVMIVGWQGSAINALGQGYELRVIASTGDRRRDLMGGEGGAYGALVGRGPHRGDPQLASDGRRRCQLAGRLCRPVHRVGGSAPADPRQTLGLSRATTREDTP